MSPLDVVFAAAGMLLGVATFYMTYQRPERRRRQRFFDEAIGHPAADGIPEKKSLFERMDCMQDQLNTVKADVATMRDAVSPPVPQQRRVRSAR